MRSYRGDPKGRNVDDAPEEPSRCPVCGDDCDGLDDLCVTCREARDAKEAEEKDEEAAA